MNKTTKPISSPGRTTPTTTTTTTTTTEKFPPLMRFLRSNVGNKSRRRSRASPMFVRKKNTPFETTQEPSSPKVTCIGQVRVRRSKKKNHINTTVSNHQHRCNRLYGCLKNIKHTSTMTSITSVLSKCPSLFKCGSCCCYNNNNPEKKERRHLNQIVQKEKVQQIKVQQGKEQKQEEDKKQNKHQEEQHEKEDKHVTPQVEIDDDINEGLIPKTPPKNAFLLTRCRSAPYRSPNSLGNMFRESTVENSCEEEVEEKIKILKINKEDEQNDEEDIEGTTCNESDGCEESKVVPLILSRCKSEPARTWDQLFLV